MAYLTKETLLAAYKVLSTLSENPSAQGATQKVSAIRYVLALDMFHKEYNRECDTRNAKDKAAFIANVGAIVGVNDGIYTSNFYTPILEHQGDFAVGSNFYSVGAVRNSLTNPSLRINYPQRGTSPLFEIQNGKLYWKEELLKSFKYYVPTDEFKCALALWICRNRKVRLEDIYSTVKSQIEILFTAKLAEMLVPTKDIFESATKDLNVSADFNPASITKEDIEDMFNKDLKDKLQNMPTFIEPTTEEPAMISQDYQYMAAIKTKPFLILGGFSGTGKSIAVKSLAFTTCPCDGKLNTSETSPGNYLLLSVKPNWHDATDITGFRSSVNRNYYVTDFMRFVVKAKMYEDKNVPFFVCLDEMNLAPVEEYFADFLSVIESRTKKSDGRIVTDPLIPASVFNDAEYADDFNIFLSLGIHPTEPVKDITEFNELIKNSDEDIFYQEQWLVDELKLHGMTIPQNLIVVGTVNMDDTTNSFSRKVIDRAMTFETVVGKFSVEDYFDEGTTLLMEYCKRPAKGSLYLSDEVRATDIPSNYLKQDEKEKIIDFINNINQDLSGTPFQISYRVLNETILLYRSKKEINKILGGEIELGVDFSLALNDVFDDILMQKVLPRIEGDYDKCHIAIANLHRRATDSAWKRSIEKLEFMEKRFGNDKSGFTSFWN